MGVDPERFFVPAYVGHKGWVGMRLDDGPDWDEVTALVIRSIMAFPAPVGILTGAAIVASLKYAPRWTSVNFDQRHMVQPAPDAVIVAYRVQAVRGGTPPYSAYCVLEARPARPATRGLDTIGWVLAA